ncbi:MAG: MlaD family protein [Desulfosoma sp.]
MGRPVSPFKIGLFVLSCGLLGTAALIWLGASHLFEAKEVYVTYFAESVKGLQKDAIVNYRGVAVGRVVSVGLGPDGRLIEVVMHLRPDFAIDDTLSIRLREQGLTGLRFLEIDSAPSNIDALTPKIDFQPPYRLIRSYPSEIQELKMALESLYGKILAMDLEGLTAQWKRVGHSVEGLLSSEDLALTVKNIRQGTESLARTAAGLEKAVGSAEFQGGLKELGPAVAAARRAGHILAQRLEEIPPGRLDETTRHVAALADETQKAMTQWKTQTNETLLLLNQDLYALKNLLDQFTTTVRTIREEPERVIFPGRSRDPFEKRGP